MDKFGIFNVLNSLLSGFGKDGISEESSSDANPAGQNNTQNKKPANPDIQGKTQKPLSPPLQSSMLNVLNSHDAFIKRVREKNKK